MAEDFVAQELAQRLIAHTDPALLAWFEQQRLCRYAVEGDAEGGVVVIVAPPVILLGPGDGEARACPNPDLLGYPEKRLAEMSLNDYHIFLLRWFTRAVAAGTCRCITCKQAISDDPAAPWDGIFVDKELVCWLINHFDCKRGLAREMRGRHAFEVTPLPPELYDVSHD